MKLALLALIVPLCLDTFAVSVALGVGGLSGRERLKTSLLFAAFESGMPLLGLLLGRPLGDSIGAAADYAGLALLAALGLYWLLEGDEESGIAELARRPAGAAIALGLSISLDELAIGFTLGLLGAPVLPVVLLIGAQALLVSQVGMHLGGRVGRRIQERTQTLAGSSLLLLAAGLLAVKLA